MSKSNKDEALWCLPYDSESVFTPFLKVPFSKFINNIISNQHFQTYQIHMAKEINDKQAWNDKCWSLIAFFEFINYSFQISQWDTYITFIEETVLRKTLGHLRLWIDTERLYLFNFLKLDSSQFQQDRIYMALFRTLNYFNCFFNEYSLKDFSLSFLNNFFKKSVQHLEEISQSSTNEAVQIISRIIKLLQNVKKKERILIEPIVLNNIKKNAKIKVTKQTDIIKQVEDRLKYTVSFQTKINEQTRILKIVNIPLIDELTHQIIPTYDPIARISLQYKSKPTFHEGDSETELNQEIIKYKHAARKWEIAQNNAYKNLNENNHNPYIDVNFSIYGGAVKIDMSKKRILEKTEETEVISREESDETKHFYEAQFQRATDEAHEASGRVTQRDLNLMARKHFKGDRDYKNKTDQNTKVYNLKWHKGQSSSDRRREDQLTAPYSKDYDNNLLFKTPLDDHLAERQKKKIDQLMEEKNCKSLTIANLERMADQIHPETLTRSFGTNLFLRKQAQILDLKNFKLLNQNKFDFMRKVIGYMTAQRKIKNIINDKNTPEFYPRNYWDIKQDCYNPQLQYSKVNFAYGRQEKRPNIYI